MHNPAAHEHRRIFPNRGTGLSSYANRTLDIFCCLLALPLLATGVLVMTAVTGIISPGPVFFRQERIGFKGRRFKIWKFRTMQVAAKSTVHQVHFNRLVESNLPMVKLDDQRDTRLIPGGWILRASGLDELPQLLNILRGEMSVVGPRPCIPSEFEAYLPSHRERFNAAPGLTGLWQVSGKNRTTFEEMVRLDIHYARHASLALNLKIMLRTPSALVAQIRDSRMRRKSSAKIDTPQAAVV
jgi:lipopolysaccharide/colanic/teichoic acid biosynthesis glycosyltransferase